MKRRNIPFYCCLGILSVIILFWLFLQLLHDNAFKGVYHQTNPDSLLFARHLEQSILKGRVLVVDDYAAFPYKTRTGFAPFYMYFLVTSVNIFFYFFSNSQIDPVYVAGMFPVLIPWLTSIILIFTIYKLTNNKVLTLFVSMGMLPGFFVVMISGFFNLDYDYLISFFIWLWVISGAFYLNSQKNIFVYLGAIITALFISTWTGSPFFYFFATVYAFILWLVNTEKYSDYLTYASVSMFIGSIVALIFVPRNEDTFRYFLESNVGRYSYIQGLLVLLGAIFIAFLNQIKNTKRPRIYGLSILGIVILGIVIFFHETLFQATGILFQTDPIHATIGELSASITYKEIYNEGLKDFLYRFGPFLLVFPLCLFLKYSEFKKLKVDFILNWVLILLSLSLFYQVRYVRWMGCGYGLVIGFSCWCLWETIKKSIENTNYSLQRTALCVLPIILFGITVNFAFIRNKYNLSKEEVDIYSWIKENTPETSGYSDDNEPEYGILAYWDEGNKLSFFTKRPVAVSNSMWGYKTMADIFSSEEEKKSFALCKKYRLRYIMIEPSRPDSNNILSYWPLFKNMPETSEYKLYYGEVPQRDSFDYFYFWLKDHLGLTPLGEFGNSSHFRMIYANKNDGNTISKYVLFECVEGAVCDFNVEPGSIVSISLELKVGELSFIYKVNKTTDEKGSCTLVLPYSNGYDNGNILTEPFYKVSVEKDEKKTLAKLVVCDKDVVEGRRVDMETNLEIVNH